MRSTISTVERPRKLKFKKGKVKEEQPLPNRGSSSLSFPTITDLGAGKTRKSTQSM
jgi:hypothetical protein